MTTASEAAASITSDSVMPPTPSRMMLTVTCSCGSRAISSASASSEPATSALTTRLSSFSPRSARASTSSSDTRRVAWRASAACLRRMARSLATRRASRSFSTTRKFSPASGTPSKPRISTGMPGRRLLHALAAVVVHRAHAAQVLAGHDRVADLQAAAVDEQRDHGAAARVELRLDHEAGGVGVRVGLQLLDLGERDERLEQVVEVLPASWPRRPRTRCRRPSRPASGPAGRARRARGWGRRPPCRSC